MSRFSRGLAAALMDFGGGELIRLIEVAAASSSSVYFFLPSLCRDPPEFNCDVVKWDYGSAVGVVVVVVGGVAYGPCCFLYLLGIVIPTPALRLLPRLII